MIFGRVINNGILDQCYGSRKKLFIGSLIGAAVSIGSSIFGANEAAKAEQRAREKEAKSHAENMALINRQKNESYADSAAGRNVIRQSKEYGDRIWKKAQGASAVGGDTDASTAMAKEAGNNVVSGTLGNVAAQDTARQDSATRMAMSENARYSSQQASQLRQQGANTAQAASSLGNAIGGIAGAFDSKSNTAAQKSVASSINFDANNTPGVDTFEGRVNANMDDFRAKQLAEEEARQRASEAWNMYK